MAAAIEVANVSKSYRRYRPDRPQTIQEVLAGGVSGLRATERFWALRDVSFSVPRGRAVAIVGTNGSGKSTLLRLVGGIGTPDSGRVRVAGRVGALLDLGSGLHGDLTGRENVIVAGVLNGLSRREVLRRFDDIVAFSEIEKFIDNPMRTYSSGMQMRLAFAINAHTDPDVLLIDEVLAVGDAAFQRKCLAHIRRFKANGCSILLVSHGLAIVKQLCDEVIWMNAGHLMAHGRVGEVVRQYEAHVGCAMESDATDESAGASPPASASRLLIHPAPVAHRDNTLADSDPTVAAAPPQIVAVGLVDGEGHPLAGFQAGQALRVVIDFVAPDALPTLRFWVRVIREDGLICCEFFSGDVTTHQGPTESSGRVTLVIDRLDLHAGRYRVDATGYQGRFSDGAAPPMPGGQLIVMGDAPHSGVLSAPHRWYRHDYGQTSASPQP